jgi:hypothetical protein
MQEPNPITRAGVVLHGARACEGARLLPVAVRGLQRAAAGQDPGVNGGSAPSLRSRAADLFRLVAPEARNPEPAIV